MKQWKTILKGHLRISIYGPETERFLTLCKNNGFSIWDVTCKNKENFYECNVSVQDFHNIQKIRRKTHTRLHILQKKGFPFWWIKNKRRSFFLGGFFLFFTILSIMSCFIWNIHVEGNKTYTTQMILSFLQTQAVTHGMQKKDVDCTDIAESVRKEFSEITWVSVRVSGTRLLIEVKENTNGQTFSADFNSDKPKHIVASKEGTILSIMTRKGIPLKQNGDECEAGEILVSGEIEILDDAGVVSNYQYVQADADIMLQTHYYYYQEFPLTYKKRMYTGEQTKQFYYQLGNIRIITGKEKSPFSFYESIASETQLRLTENYYLPLRYGVITSLEYKEEEYVMSEEEARKKAKEELFYFLEKLKEKGVQICSNHVKIDATDTCCIIKGKIEVIESTGEWQDVQVKEERIPLTQ